MLKLQYILYTVKFTKGTPIYRQLILTVLLIKIIILIIFPIFAGFIVVNLRLSSLEWYELWNVWDAPHYLSIAQFGYKTSGDEANFIVFLPFFPLLVKLSKIIFQTNYLFAGYMVSFLASVGLAIMLYKLTKLDFSEKISLHTVVLIFLFPTSFFLHIPYTEALFIFLCVTSFFFIRKKNFLVAFLLGGLASFTRLSGLALIPAFLLEIYSTKLTISRKLLYMILAVVISADGFLLYLLINYQLWGNFFQFSLFEKQNWYTSFDTFGGGLRTAITGIGWRRGLEGWMLGYGQLIAFFLGLIMGIYTFFKIRKSYAIFMLGVLYFSFTMSFWLSMPRYILSLFPMFIALSLFSENIFFRYIWIFLSVVLLFFLGLIFIQYGPVF